MFSEKMGKVKKAVDADVYELYKLAFSCVKYEGLINIHGNVHPLNLAAACLYSNGETDVAVQMKGLSYGCSLDPVSQLIGNMVSRLTLGSRVSAEDDINHRTIESRVRHRSRDRTMGLISRGNHQHSQKRAVCTHCGAGRAIVLSVKDTEEDKVDSKAVAIVPDRRAVSPADFSHSPTSSAASSARSTAPSAFGKVVSGAKGTTPDQPVHVHPRLHDQDRHEHDRQQHDGQEEDRDRYRDSLNSEADFKDTSRPGTHTLAVREMFDDAADGDDDDDDDGFGEVECDDAITVRWVVLVDQFGITHAPPGQARALLAEQGFGQAMVVVHNERGAVVTVSADGLLPSPSGVGRILKITDFV